MRWMALVVGVVAVGCGAPCPQIDGTFHVTSALVDAGCPGPASAAPQTYSVQFSRGYLVVPADGSESCQTTQSGCGVHVHCTENCYVSGVAASCIVDEDISLANSDRSFSGTEADTLPEAPDGGSCQNVFALSGSS